MLGQLFAVIVVTTLVLRYFWTREVHPIDKLPGPKRLPFIGATLTIIFEIALRPNKLFETFVEFNKLYGDRYQFQMLNQRSLSTSNPSDIEIILSNTKNLKKSFPYFFLESWLGTGLLLSTGSKWHKRRKILTPTFHFNILKNFYTVMEEKSRDLIQRIKKFDGKEVEVLPLMSDFTLYTICETAMGTQLDSDKTSAAVEYKNAISEIGSTLINRLSKFWLHSDFVFRLLFGKSFSKYLEIVQSFADNVILERKKQRNKSSNEIKVDPNSAVEDIGIKKRLAMLDLLLEAENKGEIQVEGIKEEVNTFMFEGHDTTAMGLTFCLMLLAEHEDVQERVFEECRQVLGNKRSATLTDLTEMKYLDAVLKESLRMYPSVPLIGREITQDFYMNGLLVKKGTVATIMIYDLHHREDLFPEPERFRPERFLDGEVQRIHPYGYIPFSAGPRNCIGQRFAMQEMKCAISDICNNFRLVPLKKGIKPALVTDMVLRPAEPIMIKFISRDTSGDLLNPLI